MVAGSTLRRVEDLPELMTRAELAEFTGISLSTLAKWVGEKKGPPVTKLGHAARYRKEHVLEWLRSAAG